MKKVAVLVGSLRRESINLKFAKALAKLADSRMEFVYTDLGSLPHYNDDLWENPPEPVLAFKRVISSADAVLFVIPEINRAVPALVTNAFTWASRPWGQSAWSGKPGAIVGTSPGVIGSAVAQSQLRGQMALFEIHLMGQPEVYFQTKPGLIDENFDVTDEKTRAFLQGWVAKFDRWIERVNAQEAVSVAAK